MVRLMLDGAKSGSKLSLCCYLFVVVFAAASGCVREVNDGLGESTTQDKAPEAGPKDGVESSSISPADTTSQSSESSSTTSQDASTSSTQESSEKSDESESVTSDGGGGEPTQDSSDESSGETTEDDADFEFIDKLTGDRPCSGDRVRWLPVESYKGQRLNFPVTPVKALERATLTGPCDATLIGPDLAITGAQCKIKPGITEFALRRQSDASGTAREPIPVKVASILERKYSASAAFEYTIFRLEKQVGPDDGWVKLAALRLDQDELVGMVHAPQSMGEVFSAGTVVSARRGEFVATRSLHAQRGSQGAGVIDAWGFLVATHVTGSCCDGSIEGCGAGKELGWQSSLFAAYSSSAVLRDQLSAWLVWGPGEGFASDGSRIFGIQPGGERIWKYSGTPDKWDPVGPAADALYGGGGEVYARHKDSVSRYIQASDKWELVVSGLDPDDILDVDKKNGDLYRLPADRQRVERLVGGRWNEIGGPASSMFAIHDGILAESPDGSAVWRWNPQSNKWKELGSGGIAFLQSSDGTIFRHDRKGVYEMRGSVWQKLSGPVKKVVVGSQGKRSLFATDFNSKELMQYDASSKRWKKTGRPCRGMYTIGTQIFAEDDKSRDLVGYRPL